MSLRFGLHFIPAAAPRGAGKTFSDLRSDEKKTSFHSFILLQSDFKNITESTEKCKVYGA